VLNVTLRNNVEVCFLVPERVPERQGDFCFYDHGIAVFLFERGVSGYEVVNVFVPNTGELRALNPDLVSELCDKVNNNFFHISWRDAMRLSDDCLKKRHSYVHRNTRRTVRSDLGSTAP